MQFLISLNTQITHRTIRIIRTDGIAGSKINRAGNNFDQSNGNPVFRSVAAFVDSVAARGHGMIVSKKLCRYSMVVLVLIAIIGCHTRRIHETDTGHGDVKNMFFGKRHTKHLPRGAKCDPLISLAAEITDLEDDIRRDGSITVKKPDVWGDANLMAFIQEYDGLLAESVKNFNETIQAYIARSDQAEFQSLTGLGVAVGTGTPVPLPETTKITVSNDTTQREGSTLPTPIDIDGAELFKLMTDAAAAASPAAEKKAVGVEPTELERQRSTFIRVNQALRLKNMGDDNSRAAGYGLYKFRVPVSVLPGRETHEGHSAVVNMRAQLVVDENHLRYTFPKLVIADIVEQLTPILLDTWGNTTDQEECTAVRSIVTDTNSAFFFAEKTNEDLVIAIRKVERIVGGAGMHPDVDQAIENRKQAVRMLRRISIDNAGRQGALIAMRNAADSADRACDKQQELRHSLKAVESAIIAAAAIQEAAKLFEKSAKLLEGVVNSDTITAEPAELADAKQSVAYSLAQSKLAQNIAGQAKSAAESLIVKLKKIQLKSDPTKTKACFTCSGNARKAIPLRIQSPQEVFGKCSIAALRTAARQEFGDEPKQAELRSFLFKILENVHHFLEYQNEYRPNVLNDALDKLRSGNYVELEDSRLLWTSTVLGNNPSADIEIVKMSWILGLQASVVDFNVKTILRGMDPAKVDQEAIDCVYFYNVPDQINGCNTVCRSNTDANQSGDAPGEIVSPKFQGEQKQSVERAPVLGSDLASRSCLSTECGQSVFDLWELMIKEEFPLHVFALDPQVEEQNAYGAFSRRREMSLALAISVASGMMTGAQKAALSRQIGLDQAAIDLNRTVVAFSHGDDTFGWYFYPRIQSPPPEESNIATVGRILWSGGPTQHYELKHRKLEPGIRECEVLIAMPSFVTGVSFDVTSNWERLTQPGRTKRSYEEMILQGKRLVDIQRCLCEVDDDCYRDGDKQRLSSRVDQLEHMLGMQTYGVNIPYEYELAGSELFDAGNAQLRPVVHDFHGLRFLAPGLDKKAEEDAATPDAYMFLTGKHFHPTLTHVIIGGSESHSIGNDADVEVISRELLSVKINKLNDKLSKDGEFIVRVATPAGVSNPITIKSKTTTSSAPATPKADFKWIGWKSFNGRIQRNPNPGASPKVIFEYDIPMDGDQLVDDKDASINNQTEFPIPDKSKAKVIIRLTVKMKDGTTRNQKILTDWVKLTSGTGPNSGNFPVKLFRNSVPKKFLNEIAKAIGNGLNPTEEPDEFTGDIFIKFDAWPVIKLDEKLTIKISGITTCPADCDDTKKKKQKKK